MNRFNPIAYVFWAICACIGYLIGGGSNTGLVAGLAIGLGVTLVVSIL